MQAFQKFINEKWPVYAFRFNNNNKTSNFYFLKENSESHFSLVKSKHLASEYSAYKKGKNGFGKK